MKTRIYLFATLLVTSTIFVYALSTGYKDVPAAIITAFKTGDSHELAKYFNTSIELLILKDENVYSKSQAEQIVKDFFNNHAPSSFTVIHEGGKEGSNYVIGKLVTNNGIFRVYFLLKLHGSSPYIHQLRIENEAG